MSKTTPNPSKRRGTLRPERATVYDIAREADVSTGTVSRALNNSEDINTETRERVLAISRRLGVRPRATVKRTHFAVVVPARGNIMPGTFVDTFVCELLQELSTRGCALSAFTEEQIGDLERWIFDGIFSTNWHPQVLETLERIQDTPVIVLNRFQDRGRFHLVGWDHVAEGRVVADYLIQRGHRRIAFVSPPPTNSEAILLRLQGLRDAAAAAGYPVADECIELLEDGSPLYAALQRVVEQRADAIFVPGQGKHAMEVMNILRGLMKLRIPEDISIIGGESPGWSLAASPPLTAVHAPLDEIAAQAVDLMHDLIARKVTQPAERLIPVSIVERKSVRNRALSVPGDR